MLGKLDNHMQKNKHTHKMKLFPYLRPVRKKKQLK